MTRPVSCLVLFLAASLAVTGLRAEGLLGVPTPPPTAPGASAIPRVQEDQHYVFLPETATEEIRSPYFDPVLDTPAFLNEGAVFIPGGSCYGFAFVTQYWYESIVYPYLGKKWRVTHPMRMRRPHLLVLPQTPTGAHRFGRNRLRSFTTWKGEADTMEEEYLKELIATAAANQFEMAGQRVRGDTEGAYRSWRESLADPAIGLAQFSFFGTNSEGRWGHAVLLWKAVQGLAAPESDPRAEYGVPVTAFYLIDSNHDQSAPGVLEDDYVLFFESTGRLGFPPSHGLGASAHTGAYLAEGDFSYDRLSGDESRSQVLLQPRDDLRSALFGEADRERMQGLYEKLNLPDPEADPQKVAYLLGKRLEELDAETTRLEEARKEEYLDWRRWRAEYYTRDISRRDRAEYDRRYQEYQARRGVLDSELEEVDRERLGTEADRTWVRSVVHPPNREKLERIQRLYPECPTLDCVRSLLQERKQELERLGGERKRIQAELEEHQARLAEDPRDPEKQRRVRLHERELKAVKEKIFEVLDREENGSNSWMEDRETRWFLDSFDSSLEISQLLEMATRQGYRGSTPWPEKDAP